MVIFKKSFFVLLFFVRFLFLLFFYFLYSRFFLQEGKNIYIVEGFFQVFIDLKVMCSRRLRIFFFSCTDNLNRVSFVCRSLCEGPIL